MNNYFKVVGKYNVGGTEMFEPQYYIVEKGQTYMLIELMQVGQKNYYINFGSKREINELAKKCVNSFWIHKIKVRPATKTDIYKDVASFIDRDFLTPPAGFYDQFDDDTFDEILDLLNDIKLKVEEISDLNGQ